MWLLIAEALLALALLVFIVMWTMSGRRRSEYAESDETPATRLTESSEAHSGDSKRR